MFNQDPAAVGTARANIIAVAGGLNHSVIRRQNRRADGSAQVNAVMGLIAVDIGIFREGSFSEILRNLHGGDGPGEYAGSRCRKRGRVNQQAQIVLNLPNVFHYLRPLQFALAKEFLIFRLFVFGKAQEFVLILPRGILQQGPVFQFLGQVFQTGFGFFFFRLALFQLNLKLLQQIKFDLSGFFHVLNAFQFGKKIRQLGMLQHYLHQRLAFGFPNRSHQSRQRPALGRNLRTCLPYLQIELLNLEIRRAQLALGKAQIGVQFFQKRFQAGNLGF